MDDPPSKRFFLWLVALCYITKRDFATSPGYLEMYHALFRSLPCPLDPPSVIQKPLQGMCPPKDAEELAAAYVAICPPDCAEVATPRKLTHLCRCVVRETYQLPKEIDALNIPRYIKGFLNLYY